MTLRRARAFILIVTGALLSACGTQYEEQSQLFGAIGRTLLPGSGDDQQTSAQSAPLTRASIEAAEGDFLLAAVPSRESGALLQKAGENGDEVTWISPDGISVTYDRGVLVATRGLGPDLMAANVSGTVAALRQGAGSSQRVHEYLDGNDQIVRRSFDCRIERAGNERIVILERSYETVRYEENCESGSQRFQNIYWADKAGVVWKSRQLISPPVGYLDSERL